jgi:PKD domain
MADPTFVQIVTEEHALTTNTVVLTVPDGVTTTEGNRLILWAHSTGGSDLIDVADNKGNDWWINADNTPEWEKATIAIASAEILNALVPGDEITCTFNASKMGTGAAVAEFSGLPSNPIDRATSFSNDGTVVEVATINLSAEDSELVFTAMGASGYSPYTLDPEDPLSGGTWINLETPGYEHPFQAAYYVASAKSLFKARWTASASTNTVAALTSYKANAPAVVPPTAHLSASPSSGTVPFSVSFSASASTAGTNPIDDYAFDFGDGSAVVHSATPTVSHSYTTAGDYVAEVTVSDTADLSDTATQAISADNPSESGYKTLAILSDPQLTSASYVITRADKCGAMLASNASGLDAICTLGDETNDNTAPEWANFWDNYTQFKPCFSGKLRPVHGSESSHVPYTSWKTQFGTPPSGRQSWSFDLGGWHIVMCQSDPAPDPAGGTAQQAEYDWISADLAAHSSMPTVMMWHKPRYDSGTRHTSNGSPAVQPLWALACQHKVEVVVCGHVHQYHRYGRMNASGGADSVNGTRLLTCTNAGQGPTTAYGFHSAVTPKPQMIGNGLNLGWIELKLYSDHYTWATKFHTDYSQQVLNTGTSTWQNNDSGSQTIR